MHHFHETVLAHSKAAHFNTATTECLRCRFPMTRAPKLSLTSTRSMHFPFSWEAINSLARLFRFVCDFVSLNPSQRLQEE